MTQINMQERTEETLEARLKQALDVAIALPNAEVELLGIWVWVKFPGKPADETRATLKANGFRWIHKRGRWAYAGLPQKFGSRKDFSWLRAQYADAQG